MSRRIRIEATPEPPPVHGAGEVLDVLVWGTVSRGPAPIEARVSEVERDIAAVARAALPEICPETRVEAMPFERAVFGDGADGPDQIRLRFRIVATDDAGLKRWRALVQQNLRALGIARDVAGSGAPSAAAAA